MTLLKAVLRVLRPLLTLALVVVATLMVSGQLRMEPVLTGSMAPHYPAGTLVVVTPVDGRAVRVGDVVMFVPPAPWGTPTGGPIMHRVISMKPGPDGHPQVRTKGDANAAADPWVLDADRGGFAKLRASSVLAGRLFFMLRSTAHFPAMLIWPGLAVLAFGLKRNGRARKTPGAPIASVTPSTGPRIPALPTQRQALPYVPAQRDRRGRHRSAPARHRRTDVSDPAAAR